MHGVCRLAVIMRDGMPCFVVGCQALFPLGNDAALFFGAGHHLDAGFLDVLLRDGFAPALRCKQRRLVDKVLQVCACEPGC